MSDQPIVQSSADEPTTDLRKQMEAAALAALSNVRNPDAMKNACERMDRMREETRRHHGILDIGVPAIRELRDQQ